MIRKAILQSFDAATYKASVQLTGSLATFLSGVAVARDIAPAEMVAGRKVALLVFDPSNPDDAVVTAVWT